MFVGFLLVMILTSPENPVTVSASATLKIGSGRTEEFDSVSSWISHYGAAHCYLRIIFDEHHNFDFAFLRPAPRFPVELTTAGFLNFPRSRYVRLKRRDYAQSKRIQNWPCEATLFLFLSKVQAETRWRPEFDLRQAASVDVVLCSTRHLHIVVTFSEIGIWYLLLTFLKQNLSFAQYDYSRLVLFITEPPVVIDDTFSFGHMNYMTFCCHCVTPLPVVWGKSNITTKLLTWMSELPTNNLCYGCSFEEARKIIHMQTMYLAKRFPKLYEPNAQKRGGAELSRAGRTEFGKEGASFILLKEIYHSLTNYTVKGNVKRILGGHVMQWAPDPELYYKHAPPKPHTTYLPTKTDSFNFITCAKKPQELVMGTYLEPFEGQLWFWFLLVNILCAIFLVLIFKNLSPPGSKVKRESWSIGKMSLLCLAVLLERGEMIPDFKSDSGTPKVKGKGQDMSKVKGHIFRFCLVLWILSGVVLSNSYRGKLTSDVTAGNSVEIYETFDELGKAEFRLYSAFVQFSALGDPNSRDKWLAMLEDRYMGSISVVRDYHVHQGYYTWGGPQGEEFFRLGAKIFGLQAAVTSSVMRSSWDLGLLSSPPAVNEQEVVKQVNEQIKKKMEPMTKLLAVPANFPRETPEQLASTCGKAVYVDYNSDLKKFVPQSLPVPEEVDNDLDSDSDTVSGPESTKIVDHQKVTYTKGKEHFLPENVGYSVVGGYKGGDYVTEFIKRFAVESGIHNWLSDRLPAIDKKSLEFIWSIQDHENQKAKPLSASTNLVQTNFIIFISLSVLSFAVFMGEIHAHLFRKLCRN